MLLFPHGSMKVSVASGPSANGISPDCRPTAHVTCACDLVPLLRIELSWPVKARDLQSRPHP